MSEIERVIENLFLIKILKKEESELSKFSNTLSLLNSHMLNKHIFGIIKWIFTKFSNLNYFKCH